MMVERRNGINRNERWNKNLLDDTFKIEPRSFAKNMGYLSSFLEKINFYNTQNKIDGNWKKLIENDPILYMISMINEPKDQLDTLIQDFEDLETEEYNKSLVIKVLLDWYTKINNWHNNLLRLHEEKLANKIKNVLEDILKIKIEAVEKFNQNTSIEKKDNETSFRNLGFAPSPTEEIKTSKDFKRILFTFNKIIIHIQSFTETYLEKSLLSRNSHMPHNAMYITFGLLFKTIQEKLNGLSQKHLDFYYCDVLKQTSIPSQPTKSTVYFELLPTIKKPTIIPKRTRLLAGKPFGSKTDVLFETNSDLVAHNIELMEMETLFFNSSPYIRMGTDDALISSVSKNKLIISGHDVDDTRDDWFTFGANKESIQNSQIQAEKAAEIGFIIGSPALMVSEGKREINIKITLEKKSSEKIFWKLLKQIQTKRKISLDTAISIVFDESLYISYSSKKGWLDFESYSISYDKNANYFAILLVLKNTDPALEKSTAIKETLSWPSIKVLLNNYAPVYLYSFLKEVEIENIKIDVDVQKMRNLSIYNNIGKMPLGKSFDLFGPFPKVGSYLMVGKPELFKKQVTFVEVNLGWETIPLDYGGFDTYYNAYSESIENDSFKVQFTALSNSSWLPIDLKNSPSYNLFSVSKCLSPEGYESVQLDSSRTIEFEGFNDIAMSEEDMSLKEPLEYTVNTQSGFVKLTLAAPTIGFGHDIYQKDVAEIATYNAKNKKDIPFPNKPFVPKVSNVSINYKATDTLYFNIEDAKKNKGELLHIRPFWVDMAVAEKRIAKYTLFPDYSAQGYLILGLKGVVDNPVVTLFFHFLRSGSTNNIQTNDSLEWEYFLLNKWVKLENENILKDGTRGLTKSGTIELRLPKAEKPEEELYWLRVSTKKNAEHYPKIKGIYLNAVQATCISDDPLVIGKKLAPGTIKKVIDKLPDIKKVIQPATSFAGAFEESKPEFYGRISERLRHKSRSVTSWDYERLLLEKFDTIAVVKCTNLNKNFKPIPGNVNIVVVNSKWAYDERYYFKRAALDYMSDYLKKYASSFINIQVINPIVEYVLVNCVIEFKQKSNEGYFLNHLNDEISNFLSPVSNIANGLGGIGGHLIPTIITSFINKLDYVKRVEKLSVEHIIRKRANDFSLGLFKDTEIIRATTPLSILNPVEKHHIINATVKNESVKNIYEIGIAKMEIGSDFIIEQK